jgi:hypothetical protein
MKSSSQQKQPVFRHLADWMGWTRASYYLLSGFLLTVFLIIYVWWPLAEEYLALIDWSGPWWLYIDWLLIGIFLFMSLLIMAGADLRADVWIVFVGLVGGLVIESWGTQTEIWTYYTDERPPMWIIPAWPIASLSIDRLVRLLRRLTRESTKSTKRHEREEKLYSWIYPFVYWLIFPAFYALMLQFVWPTLNKSLTIMALLLVGFLTLTPRDHRVAVLTFAAGAGLGYFLERWGTTRLCWTYYTRATPPLFAVLAHGMAAVAFWRTADVLRMMAAKLKPGRVFSRLSPSD